MREATKCASGFSLPLFFSLCGVLPRPESSRQVRQVREVSHAEPQRTQRPQRQWSMGIGYLLNGTFPLSPLRPSARASSSRRLVAAKSRNSVIPNPRHPRADGSSAPYPAPSPPDPRCFPRRQERKDRRDNGRWPMGIGYLLNGTFPLSPLRPSVRGSSSRRRVESSGAHLFPLPSYLFPFTQVCHSLFRAGVAAHCSTTARKRRLISHA